MAARAGLPLADARHAGVAAIADHIHSVVSTLRELDFGDTPPAAAYRAAERLAWPDGVPQGTPDAVSGENVRKAIIDGPR